MSLEDEIKEKSKEITTDSYPMSIGEIINLYKDGEIDLQPDFQRIYRWSDTQKSKLIESILLGIPIPSIFVFQREDGIWDVIDGVQRLSTIFEFTGDLKDSYGRKLDASILTKTKYLPSLENKKWDDENNIENSLTQAQRLFIKRARINVQIIKKESDPEAKFELFQRLNSGGTILSYQEIRNSLLVMINKDFFNFLKILSENVDFRSCISISDSQEEERFDMELVTRFLISKNIDLNKIKGNEDINEFLTEKILEIAKDESFEFNINKKCFENTFKYLNELLGNSSFRKFNKNKSRHEGQMILPLFELITSGISKNLDKLQNNKNLVNEKIQNIYDDQTFSNIVSRSKAARPISRFKELSILGQNIFNID